MVLCYILLIKESNEPENKRILPKGKPIHSLKRKE
jgi:hypothetical protein